MSTTKEVIVNILDKPFTLRCQAEEEHNLLNCASFLDKKMREIKAKGKVVGMERIAVMAALNLTAELQAKNKIAPDDVDGKMKLRIQNLHEKLDTVLE